MTFITQAIETKYLKATDRKNSRIKATAYGGSVVVNYDYELNTDENHFVAAMALRQKMGWDGIFAQGGNVKGDGYYFVNVKGA